MEKERVVLYYRRMSSPLLPGVHRLHIQSAPQLFYCEPDWAWRPKPLPDHDLWFVAEGRGALSFGDQRYELMPGRCFVIRPGETPYGEQDPQHRLVVFGCHFEPLNATGSIVSLPPLPRPLPVHDLAFFIASAHHVERLRRREDPAAWAQIHDLLLTLLHLLWDESAYPPAPEDVALEALAAAVRREPSRRWTLDEMARHCHLSRAQFTRRFRAAYRTSPTHFLIQLRLERARQLLIETDLTLEQIAAILGYGDVYFFSRQFKQFSGKTPGEVRRGFR